MDIQQCTIYVRLYRRTIIQEKQIVLIGQVADIAAPPEIKAIVEAMPILNIKEHTRKGKYAITIIEIINKVWGQYPAADVQSVGDPDAVIEYMPKKIKEHSVLEWAKAIAGAIIVFAGASVAIMTYNTDTSLGKTFTILNRIFTGKEVDNPILITIPYSIGIALGVIFFFNHLGRRKITEDPTPMQVEMELYEVNAEISEIESLTDKRRRQP